MTLSGVLATAITIVIAVASATSFTTTSATASAATATTAAQRLGCLLHLLQGSGAVCHHLPLEMQNHTCQRMVQVNGNLGGGYLCNGAIETLALGILKRHHSTYVDVILIYFAIDFKHVGWQLLHSLLKIGTVSLLRSQCKGKLLALVQVLHLDLEIIQSQAHTGYELKRMFQSCLLTKSPFTIMFSLQPIAHCNVFVFHFSTDTFIL